MTSPIKVNWSDTKESTIEFDDTAFTPEYRDLGTNLLNIAGRYLSCILQRSGDEIEFTFEIRRDETGFLKLDIGQTIIAAAIDCRQYEIEQFIAIADKYYTASHVNTEFLAFVPAVVFGCSENLCFYIESPQGFGRRVDAFFIRASHNFIASMLKRLFQDREEKISKYLETLLSGRDPKAVVAREPLMRAIISNLPEESIKPFYSQLVEDLRDCLKR